MKEVINLSGTFYGSEYTPGEFDSRESFISKVNLIAKKKNYSFMKKLNFDYLIHLDRQYTTNLYFRDWERIMPILKSFYGKGNLYVVNGFRSPFELGVNVHSTGLAMDILVDNKEQAERLMNAAYMVGIPTIIPAGDIRRGQGHVHLDLAPKPDHVYDAGTYTGPWGRI